MKQTFVIQPAPHPSRQRALDAVRQAPDGFCVTVAEPSRSSAENALLHALIGEIAASQEWAGAKRGSEVWKRLLTAAWCRATNQQVELLPALDGHGVDIVYRKTSQLTKKECADLIEFVYAWGANNGIMWSCQNEPSTT